MRRASVIPLLFIVAVLAACTSDAPPQQATPTAEPTPTAEATARPEATATATATGAATATPIGTAAAPPLTAQAAAVAEGSVAAMAGWLGVDRELLSLDHVVRTNWPDSCLGIGRPDEPCDDAIVPGFLVRIFLGGEWSYQVRSNLDGSQLVWATEWIVEGTFLKADDRLVSIAGDFPDALSEHFQQYVIFPGSDVTVVGSLRYGDPVLVAGDGRPSSDVPLVIWIARDPTREPPAASDPERVAGAALQALSAMIDSGGLMVASIELVEWPDICLGFERPGVRCAVVPFPGFRVLLDHVSGTRYEIRSDDQGSQFVWVGDRVVEGIVREVTVANSVRVETEEGELIWARVVAGSTLGTPIASSLLDDRLRLTLAPHPQGNGWAVVVLEQLAGG